MKTSITTNGKETRIVLVPENILEEKLIEALNVYRADVTVGKTVDDNSKTELYLDIKHKE